MSPRKKSELIKKYLKIGLSFPKLIHKNSYVSKSSIIEEGAQIFAGAIVNANTKIKSYSVINTGSIIEHDCVIGENSFVCPGSIILGSCKIGKNTVIGSKTLYCQKLAF